MSGSNPKGTPEKRARWHRERQWPVPTKKPGAYSGRRDDMPYNEDVAHELLDRLCRGEPLALICDDPHMPHVRTIRHWKNNVSGFREMYDEARLDGIDYMAADTFRIADRFLLGITEEVTHGPEGIIQKKIRREDALGRAKLMIDTRLKLIRAWAPQRYAPVSSRYTGEGSGSGGPGSINVVGGLPDDEEDGGLPDDEEDGGLPDDEEDGGASDDGD